MENAAKIYYPYLPVKILLKDKYDSINKVNTIKVPILNKKISPQNNKISSFKNNLIPSTIT